MNKMMRTTALSGALIFMAASAHAMDDGFMVGDTTFKIGGYVDMDLHRTEFSKGDVAANSIARDIYIPSVTPTGGADDESSEYFDMTAETSRLSFTATNGGTKGYIELDFWGVAGAAADGNERVSSSFQPRLRRAFVQTDNWLIGQEWSTFQNLSAIPESASFLVASDAQVFVRQPQIRYTSGPIQVALENPGESRITEEGAGRHTLDNAERPDVIVRFNHKADFGNISASVISRQIKAVDNSRNISLEEDAIGYNIAGRINLGEGNLRFSYVGGEGLGRYVGLHAANEAHAGGDDTLKLDLIESDGYVLAYQHPVGMGRINIGLSELTVDKPLAGALETVGSQYVAYLWSPKPKLTYGVEFMTGTRENAKVGSAAATEGDVDRFTFSTKFAF